MPALYEGTYNVLHVTGLPAFDYFFSLVVVFFPVLVIIHLVLKVLSRS